MVFTSIVDKVLTLPAPVALAIVFLIPALEASILLGFILPGEIAVLLGGVLASQHGTVNIYEVLLVACLGAVIGDQVGYLVGAKWGEALLRKVPDRIISPRQIAAGEAYVRKLGWKAVVLGRWAAALRALVPGICGIAKMPYKRFAIANIAGGCAWATAVALAGYAAGNSYKKVEKYFSGASFAIIGVVVVAVVIIIGRKRRKSEHAKMESLADEGQAVPTGTEL